MHLACGVQQGVHQRPGSIATKLGEGQARAPDAACLPRPRSRLLPFPREPDEAGDVLGRVLDSLAQDHAVVGLAAVDQVALGELGEPFVELLAAGGADAGLPELVLDIGLALVAKDEAEELARELTQRFNMNENDGKKFLADLPARFAS